MANWCNIRLSVFGPAGELTAFRKAAGRLEGRIEPGTYSSPLGLTSNASAFSDMLTPPEISVLATGIRAAR